MFDVEEFEYTELEWVSRTKRVVRLTRENIETIIRDHCASKGIACVSFDWDVYMESIWSRDAGPGSSPEGYKTGVRSLTITVNS
jgi:hypothetical protein